MTFSNLQHSNSVKCLIYKRKTAVFIPAVCIGDIRNKLRQRDWLGRRTSAPRVRRRSQAPFRILLVRHLWISPLKNPPSGGFFSGDSFAMNFELLFTPEYYKATMYTYQLVKTFLQNNQEYQNINRI